MKRLMEWAARLYPRAWRERYGAEFRALIEDVRPGWRELWDVLRGAFGMQMRTWELPKFAIGFGLVGLVVAGVIAFRTQDLFQSSALIRIPAGADAIELLHRAQVQVLSRQSLAEVILKEDLYKDERRRRPFEEIVLTMRNQHIRIAASPSGPGPGTAFRIEFQYPDELKVQQTTDALMNRMLVETRSDRVQPTTLEVIDPPSPGTRAASSNRLRIIALGLALGLLLGALVWGVKRWPIVALAGAGGAFVAAGLSLLAPDQYISSAVLRVDSPDDVNRIVERALSSQSLSDIILDGSHPLYPKERKTLPIAEIVERMRRDVQIQSGRTMATFHVTFMYPDRYLAQTVVRKLVAAMMEANVKMSQAAATKGRLELIDPPYLSDRAVSPNRGAIALGGCFAGLTLSAAIRWVRRRRMMPDPA